jgi:hypothetical protein
MKPIDRSELLDLGSYEQVREQFMRRIIEAKKPRRLPIGSNMTILFENRDSVLFQVQEMLRTERITKENAILHELETYNELVPGEDQLSATIFIEYTEREERDRMLVQLAGVEAEFYLEVNGERIAMQTDKRGDLADRTLAVHYMKIQLSPAAAQAIRTRTGGRVAVGVDHPRYRAHTPLPDATLASLAEDLSD